ncbi:MAG: uncharacterized protein V7603_3493 [Micromonosporaceae bacterium]
MTQPPNQYPPGPPNPDVPPGQPGYTPPPQPGYPPPPPPPPGYPPAGGGYPPPGGGFPPPAAAPPPPGYASSDEKTWALISHFGGAAGSFVCGGALAIVAPLVAYLAKGKESPTVKAHATAALNFFIPVSAVSVLAWIVYVCVGALSMGAFGTLLRLLLSLVLIATWACGVIFGILAGIKANEGTLYKYPLPFTIVK